MYSAVISGRVHRETTRHVQDFAQPILANAGKLVTRSIALTQFVSVIVSPGQRAGVVFQLPLGRQASTSTPYPSAGVEMSPVTAVDATTPKTPRTPGPEELKLQEETKAALKELQEEFNLYRKEKNTNEQ